MSGRPWVERAIVPGTRKTTELYAYLPYEQGSNRYWLKRVLGKGVRLSVVQRHGRTAWKLGREHMLRLAAAMADKYGEIELRFEISTTMQCDTNCTGADPATVFKCVCKCGGENHGGVGRYSDWYRAGRTTLLRTAITEVKQVVITRGQIQLPAEERETPAPEADPPAPVESARSLQPPLSRQVPAAAQSPEAQPAPAGSEPRTVIPAAARFGDRARRPADPVAPPATTSPRLVPGAGRRSVAGSLIAAVLAVVAVGGGTWLAVQPHHNATRQVTNQEPVPASTTEKPPPPPAPRPIVENPAPAPRFPAGCYPFQTGC